MGHVKTSSHFYKNGRVTGFGKRSTGNGRLFLSQNSVRLGWMGTVADGDYMFALIANDKVIGYLKYNVANRQYTTTMLPSGVNKWDFDVDMNKMIREKIAQVKDAGTRLPDDWVTADGRPARVVSPHRLQMVWDEELGMNKPINWIKVFFTDTNELADVNLKNVQLLQ
jgi:hypothetical protein